MASTRLGLRKAMDGDSLDRLARAFRKWIGTRRGLLSLAAGAAAILGPKIASGNQLGSAMCGSQGNVCTLLRGCCSGLTCVTSSTNTSYGICVTGSGGMVSASSSLISPHSETIEQDVVALEETVAAMEADTSVADLEVTRDARIAEIKARKDDKRSKRQSRLDTKRSTRRTRRDDQQERRRAAATTPTPTPRTATSQVSTVSSVVSCPQEVGASQVVTISNHSGSDVVVEQLTSLLVNPAGDEPFLALGTVSAGTTLQIYFGTAPVGYEAHATERIFDNSPLEGVRITLDSGAVLSACCDGTRTCLGEAAPVAAPVTTPEPAPRKRKKDKNKSRQKKKRS